METLSSKSEVGESQERFEGGEKLLSSPSILPLRYCINLITDDPVWGSEILDWILPDEKVADWGLPGHGTKKESCGEFFMKGCLNTQGHPDNLVVFKPMKKQCFDPKCPEDWKAWALREARRIEYRLEYAHEKHPNWGPIKHHVISVPKKDWHLSKDEMCKKAYEVAKRTNFIGGSSIYHAFRETPDGRWYFSPHLHFIGFGYNRFSAEEFKRSGWISHNEGVRKTVIGTAFYQLTHCGVWYGKGKKSSVTWFGLLSYNKLLDVPKKDLLCQVVCPYCGQPLEHLIWKGPEDSIPLPCYGIGGFYLADQGNWHSRSAVRLSRAIPEEWTRSYAHYNSDQNNQQLEIDL